MSIYFEKNILNKSSYFLGNKTPLPFIYLNKTLTFPFLEKVKIYFFSFSRGLFLIEWLNFLRISILRGKFDHFLPLIVGKPFIGIFSSIPYLVGRHITLKFFSITPLRKFRERTIPQILAHNG